MPTGTFCWVQTQGAPAAGRQKSVADPLRIIQITHTLAGGGSSALAGCIRLWAISVPAGRADGRWSSKLAGFYTLGVISLFSAAIPRFSSVPPFPVTGEVIFFWNFVYFLFLTHGWWGGGCQ